MPMRLTPRCFGSARESRLFTSPGFTWGSTKKRPTRRFGRAFCRAKILVVYSDGAVEEENTTGARFEGQRLVDIASSLQAKSAPMGDLVNQVSDAIVHFRGVAPPATT